MTGEYAHQFTGDDALVVGAREPWTPEREAELRALYPDYELTRCGCTVCTCRIELRKGAQP